MQMFLKCLELVLFGLLKKAKVFKLRLFSEMDGGIIKYLQLNKQLNFCLGFTSQVPNSLLKKNLFMKFETIFVTLSFMS